MQLFNFETILAIIVLLFSCLTFWSTIQRKKKLGEKIMATLSGLKYSDFLAQFILVVLLGIFTFLSYYFDSSGKDYRLFYVVFPAALIMFTGNALFLALTPKGFYKNGIMTYTGILSYNDVTTYSTTPRPKKNTVKLRFNPKKTIFGSGTYLEIDPSQEVEVKAYLKKHCSFKKKTTVPPPRPKRKAIKK